MNIEIKDGSEVAKAILEFVESELSDKEKLRDLIRPILDEEIKRTVAAKIRKIVEYDYVISDREISDRLKKAVMSECESWAGKNIKSSNIAEIARQVAEWSIGNLPSMIIAHVLEGANGGLKDSVMSNYFALNEMRGKVSEKLNLFLQSDTASVPPDGMREFTGQIKEQ